MTNPFFEPSTLPYGMPPFAEIRDEHYREAFEEGMAQQLAEVQAITAQRSMPKNARELRADPDGSRHRLDAAFRAAARDKSRLSALAELLNDLGLFEQYEDRFFSIVRSHSS